MKEPLPRSHRLNTRQERFCERIVAGESQTDAWLQAGYKVSRAVARRNAAKALQSPGLAARIAELRTPQTCAALLSRDQKRQLLAEIATDPTAKTADRIRAMEVDAKLAGHFEPEKIEDDGPKRLADLEKRAKHVVSVLNRFAAERRQAGTSIGLSRWNR